MKPCEPVPGIIQVGGHLPSEQQQDTGRWRGEGKHLDGEDKAPKQEVWGTEDKLQVPLCCLVFLREFT